LSSPGRQRGLRLVLRGIFSFLLVPALILSGFVFGFVRPGIADTEPYFAGFGIASGIAWALGALGLKPWFNNLMNVLAALFAVTSVGFSMSQNDLCGSRAPIPRDFEFFHPMDTICFLRDWAD